MSEPDELFTLRNHFWLGSYQLAIAEGSSLGRLSEKLRVERDEFIYRSYIALGQYSIVLGEVRERIPRSSVSHRYQILESSTLHCKADILQTAIVFPKQFPGNLLSHLFPHVLLFKHF